MTGSFVRPTVNLAFSLAMQEPTSPGQLRYVYGRDILGPSVPTLMGLQHIQHTDEPPLTSGMPPLLPPTSWPTEPLFSASAIIPITSHANRPCPWLPPSQVCARSVKPRCIAVTVWSGLARWCRGFWTRCAPIHKVGMFKCNVVSNRQCGDCLYFSQDVTLTDVHWGNPCFAKSPYRCVMYTLLYFLHDDILVPHWTITGMILNQSYFVCPSCTTPTTLPLRIADSLFLHCYPARCSRPGWIAPRKGCQCGRR